MNAATLLFVAATVGALCLWVITGGAVTMITGEKPSNFALSVGAGLGAAIGAVASQTNSMGSLGSLSPHTTESIKSMLGGGAGDGSMGMRVGLAPQGI